jgi:hypothetical protein
MPRWDDRWKALALARQPDGACLSQSPVHLYLFLRTPVFRAQALGPRDSHRPTTLLKGWRSRHRSALPPFPHLHSLPTSVCGPICPLAANVPSTNPTRTHALPGTGIDTITSASASTSNPGGLGNASSFPMTEGRDCDSSRRSARIGFLSTTKHERLPMGCPAPAGRLAWSQPFP